MARYVVSSQSLSDDISSTASSYDDGPAECGGGEGVETRLYVLNRGGTGEVHYLILTPDKTDIMSYRTHLEVWTPLVDIVNYGVVVVDNYMYILGGFDRSRAKHLKRVLRVYEDHTWKELDEHYPHILPCPLDRFTITPLDNTLYFVGGVTSRVSRKLTNKPEFVTQRRVFSFTTGISAVNESSFRDEVITPWDFKLPSMNFVRHSHGTVTLGRKLYVIGGSNLETGQPVNVCEFYNTETGMWEEDFRFRKGDMSNVTCAILDVPRIPVTKRKMTNKLKWVLW